jgi:hypothetical protein
MSFMGEAIQTYHALLDDDTARETQMLLDEAQRREGLFFGVRPIVTVLRPHFLGDDHLALLEKVCGVIATASRQTVEHARTQPHLWNRLAFTPAEQAVMDIEPGYREWSVSSRLDSFLDSETGTLQFVEYNAESPAAIAYGDVISDIFLDLPVMRAFRERYAVHAMPARARMLEALLDAYREWGGTGEPRIAIVDWRGLPTHSEFVLFQRFFTDHGIESIICAPEDLSYDGTTLRAGDRTIDLVYKRVLTSEFLERMGDQVMDHPLVRAYRDHTVCVANNFRAKLLHKKSIFALLSDEAVTEAAGVGAEDRALLAQHIPWTRFVEAGTTTYDGQEIDLLPFVRTERDHLVLKPNDDYGGKGVKIGWETPADEWERTIADAQAQPYVVQDRVHIAYEPYPMLNGDRLEVARRLVDTDPYLFGSAVQGVLTRLSSVTLLNVTAGGGSTVPTLRIGPLTSSNGNQ